MTTSQSAQPPRSHIAHITVEGYKAFSLPSTVELGRLTLVLGRNNAGKTALCFSPLFFTHPLVDEAEAPFPTSYHGVDFGTLQSVCFRRQPTGLSGTLQFEGTTDIKSLTLGATFLPEQGNIQFITRLEVLKNDGTTNVLTNIPWVEARAILRAIPSLQNVPREVHVLRGLRPPAERYHPYVGHVPETVGSFGENAPMILSGSGPKGLDDINRWFEQMRVKLRIEPRGDAFEILAAGTSGEPVNLVDSGAGVAQILPLVVATRLARARPSLFCIEQPELHLHPRAHVAAAELLLELLGRDPTIRLLVETHSDTLVLRIRREIATGRLLSNDVRMYFVDEECSDGGSTVRQIELDEFGTPKWWPKDVFAEPQKEYFAIRRELTKRGGKG